MHYGRRRRIVCATIISLLLGVQGLFMPLTALADVRKTDLVVSGTVEQRGLKAASCPSVECEYAYLVDGNGKVYFSRGADAETQIASVTKIMTAIIALERGSLDETIVVSERAQAVGESSAGLRAGDTLSLSDAIKGLMIPSGNDAALAIAETIGKDIAAASGSDRSTISDVDGYRTFIEAMNAKAEELGCTDTVFTNSHGLDYGEWAGDLHSTAEDVAKIAAYAMKIDYFREVVDMPSADLTVMRNGVKATVKVETTDLLLGVYDGACGIKTGFTDRAGSCFAGACERDGLMLYAIILKSPDDMQRFRDAEELYDWVYDNTIDLELANSDEKRTIDLDGQTREVEVVAEASLSAWLDRTVPVTFADPDASVEVFALDGNVSQSFDFYDVGGGVRVGDVVGCASFYQDNELIAEQDLIACEDVPAPDLFQAPGIWWEKLVRTFAGEPTSAESSIINVMPYLISKN